MINLYFPVEPISKARPRMTRSGHVYTPAKTKMFENSIKVLCKHFYKEEPITKPIEVKILFAIERPRSVSRLLPCVKPDIDNLTKSLLDSLNGLLWKDDALICKLEVEKIYSSPAGIQVVVNLLE